MNLSERIKSLRLAAGWTQLRLADEAGVSQQLIAKIEKGAVSESRKLPKIATAFGLTVNELLAGIASPPDRPGSRATLSEDEEMLIDAYRAASRAGKEAIMGAARGVSVAPRSTSQRKSKQLFDERPLQSAKKRDRRQLG